MCANSGMPLVQEIKRTPLSVLEVTQVWTRKFIVLIILFVALISGGWFYYDQISKRDFQLNVKWLQNIYTEHRLKENIELNYIENLVRKNKGKMTTLWRKLEKKYGIQVSKPPSL